MAVSVAVYDDDPKLTKSVVSSIKKALGDDGDVTGISDADFKNSFDVLYKRHRAARNEGAVPSDKCLFDSVDVLVIDYDLIHSGASELLTAETVAYNVRCFSDCGVILALNQYGDPLFDLTLKGHIESFADVNLGATQIGNPNLWGKSKDGFRPWYWPNVVSYCADMRKKLRDVKKAFDADQSIGSMIGIPDSVLAAMPRSLTQFVGGDDIQSATVDAFVRHSGNALRRRDGEDVRDDNVVIRLAAARISKWLEQLVLPGQNILVDAPHLVSRYPSILTNRKGVQHWDALSRLANNDDCKMLSSVIKKYRLAKHHWLSKPVWFWPQLSEDSAISEVSEPWNATFPEYCFCEDVSAFHKRDSCREFVADTESPFARRYVKALDKIEYRPAVRFAM